jgi:hypothetical protein
MPRSQAGRTQVRKIKHRRASLSGVVTNCRIKSGVIGLAVVVGLLNSECPQQNGADEGKHCAYRQHIELQGKVHGMCLPC